MVAESAEVPAGLVVMGYDVTVSPSCTLFLLVLISPSPSPWCRGTFRVLVPQSLEYSYSFTPTARLRYILYICLYRFSERSSTLIAGNIPQFIQPLCAYCIYKYIFIFRHCSIHWCISRYPSNFCLIHPRIYSHIYNRCI